MAPKTAEVLKVIVHLRNSHMELHVLKISTDSCLLHFSSLRVCFLSMRSAKKWWRGQRRCRHTHIPPASIFWTSLRMRLIIKQALARHCVLATCVFGFNHTESQRWGITWRRFECFCFLVSGCCNSNSSSTSSIVRSLLWLHVLKASFILSSPACSVWPDLKMNLEAGEDLLPCFWIGGRSSFWH